jgi:16S rRNA (guanine527-N7)-methyltransferase
LEYINKKNQPPENKPKELWRIREWFPEISDEVDRKLKAFHSDILKFNSSLGLISEKTLPLADVIHFSDCILGSREIVKDSQLSSIVDISIGNGFPSLVMAIMYPNVKVTILEKDSRKVEFLRHVSSQLKLTNVDYQIKAIETVANGSLENVMMRGYAPISKSLLLLRKQVKKGSSLYLMKSEEWATEVANIPSQLCTFWMPSLVAEYRLPIGEVKFAVVKLKKIAE